MVFCIIQSYGCYSCYENLQNFIFYSINHLPMEIFFYILIDKLIKKQNIEVIENGKTVNV